MDYEKTMLQERYNEIMFDERDIIADFLKKQADLRYGRQRFEWTLEPMPELVGAYGGLFKVREISYDKDEFVKFKVVAANGYEEWKCFNFAYGELRKIIEVLPDVKNIVMNNAIVDIRERSMNYRLDLLLSESPFVYTDGGKSIKVDMVSVENGTPKIFCGTDVLPLSEVQSPSDFLSALRDHLNVETLHRYSEYKKLVEFLSLQPNLWFEPANFGDVEFIIHGTDVKVDVLSACLDSNEKLMLSVDDGGWETLVLEEKDIRPEYLVDLVSYIEDRRNIVNTYNGHDKKLVEKINKAWKGDTYHDLFGTILLALLVRDHVEYEEKFGTIEDYSEEYAMNHAHDIMEHICDDWDLETILLFVRYIE